MVNFSLWLSYFRKIFFSNSAKVKKPVTRIWHFVASACLHISSHLSHAHSTHSSNCVLLIYFRGWWLYIVVIIQMVWSKTSGYRHSLHPNQQIRKNSRQLFFGQEYWGGGSTLSATKHCSLTCLLATITLYSVCNVLYILLFKFWKSLITYCKMASNLLLISTQDT